MTFLKRANKIFSDNWVVILVLIVAVIGIGRYSFNKTSVNDTMTASRDVGSGIGIGTPTPIQETGNVQGAANKDIIHTDNVDYEYAPSDVFDSIDSYASVDGIGSDLDGVPAVDTRNVTDPSELLPVDHNSEWAKLNPSGQGNLSQVNTLNPVDHIGQTSQVLRNPNLQLRSDPPIPRVDTGPWGMSTIEYDQHRPHFEIGPCKM